LKGLTHDPRNGSKRSERIGYFREFARHGAAVRALVRDRAKARALDASPTVEVAEGDMQKPDSLGAALDGVNRALVISSATPQMAETQCTFIDACRKAGVEHVVKFSGSESSIGFDPTKFRFARMHEEVERYLESSGLKWTHLRPSQFMQVYLREAPAIATKGAIFLPAQNIKLSPIDIEDIAKIAFVLLHGGGHEGKSYDLTGPEALTMTEIADRISRAIGKTVRYVNIALEDRRRSLLAAGLPPALVDALDEQAAERLRCPQSRVDLGAHEAFGVRPTTFSEFASRQAVTFGGDTAGLEERQFVAPGRE
jgi:uncharacterized protein YbjT (DUF2867 family)